MFMSNTERELVGARRDNGMSSLFIVPGEGGSAVGERPSATVLATLGFMASGKKSCSRGCPDSGREVPPDVLANKDIAWKAISLDNVLKLSVVIGKVVSLEVLGAPAKFEQVMTRPLGTFLPRARFMFRLCFSTGFQ